jgi:hypothetical protein
MTGMRGPANRLLSGDFGRFWVGPTISNLGSSFTMFALPLLAGLLLTELAVQQVLLVDAASFLVSAWTLVLAVTSRHWLALPLWAAINGLGIFLLGPLGRAERWLPAARAVDRGRYSP